MDVKLTVLEIIAGAIVILSACSDNRQTGDVGASADLGKTVEDFSEHDASSENEKHWPVSFGFGSRASVHDIKELDIDVRPDGQGLPKGKGVSREGRIIYLEKCAACHGQNGDEGQYDVLVSKTGKSVGTYWPYATTLFDYIRRTMPFNMPGSLTDEEVYHLTAYLLHANGIIDSSATIDASSLPRVTMPAEALFVPDDRKGGPEVK